MRRQGPIKKGGQINVHPFQKLILFNLFNIRHFVPENHQYLMRHPLRSAE